MFSVAFWILLVGQITGFLIGGIPFAYIVTWLKTGKDIRTVGSGNVGATNVGRLLGFRYFVLVFLLDFFKGAGPVLGARALDGQFHWPGGIYLPVVLGFSAILGHLFPIYLGFKGGKGVATAIGVLLCLTPIPTVAGLLGFLVTLLVTRMVSAGSIVFAVVLAGVYFWRTEMPWSNEAVALSVLVVLLALLIVVKHQSNIRRILAGTEPKISLGRSKASGSEATTH